MKALDTIQKTYKIFKALSKIPLILFSRILRYGAELREGIKFYKKKVAVFRAGRLK